jgi:4-diphosphocytidyl-2-C-methyl-D-erythritol kinase
LAPFLFVTHHRFSPCKVNLLLNILGRRADGFHELETVFQPVPLCDELTFERGGPGVRLSCSDPRLPVDAANLVHRAAVAFLEQAEITEGVVIHLDKRIPLEAGLGGGSSNAAHTLRGLNELFGRPLAPETLRGIAARLGSDVVFFLDDRPALAKGRGEQVEWLDAFAALRGAWVLLVHPGFGVPTPWAYRALAGFPLAVRGQPGRAERLIARLQREHLTAAAADFYNALEHPVLAKYPLLALFQEFLQEQGAAATLMSGSGSTTFALAPGQAASECLRDRFHERFGTGCWTAVVPLSPP